MAFAILNAPRVAGIYKITNTNNGKCYVGSSVRLTIRIQQHLALLRKGKHHNAHFQAAFTKHGESAFEVSVLEFCDSSLLIEREQVHIDQCQPAYNILDCAGRSTGYKHTQEARAKMTIANMGNKRGLGQRHTEETRKRMSELARIRPPNLELLARMSAGNVGNKHTAGRAISKEHRDKVSDGLKRAWSDDGVRSKDAAADRVRARWADPVWKQQQAEKIKAGKAARLALTGNHFGESPHKAKLASR